MSELQQHIAGLEDLKAPGRYEVQIYHVETVRGVTHVHGYVRTPQTIPADATLEERVVALDSALMRPQMVHRYAAAKLNHPVEYIRKGGRTTAARAADEIDKAARRYAAEELVAAIEQLREEMGPEFFSVVAVIDVIKKVLRVADDA